MARKVTVTLTDDLDEKLTADETLSFALDGQAYEIDLAAKNAKKVRDFLASYTTAGRKVSTRAKASAVTSTRTRARIDPAQSIAIRKWANANGYSESDRGRIKQEVLDAYNAR